MTISVSGRRARVGLLLALVVALSAPLSAQPSYTKTIADVTVAGTAAAVFTVSDIDAVSGHAQANYADCTVSAAAIRVTWDGTTPTTSSGLLMVPGQYVITGNAVLLNLKAIRNTSTSGVLSCVVYS